MKREILFRGKRIDKGEWVYGAVAVFRNLKRMPHTAIIPFSKGVNCLTDMEPVEPATVGQFTGLTDKNGKRIFEGDIVDFPIQEYAGRTRHLGVVPLPPKNRSCNQAYTGGIIEEKAGGKDMPRYIVTLSQDEKEHLEKQVQKGGKGYRIKHAQILLKLDRRPENADWSYERIKEAYHTSNGTIAGVAKRFVTEGLEAALGRKKQENHYRKVTGEVEARICTIACSAPPEGYSRWTLQMIADELVRLEVVDSITDSTVCDVMKKTKSSRGKSKNGAFRPQTQNS